MPKPTLRMTRAAAGLVVIDFQERLLAAMPEKERVLQNAQRLVQGAAILKIPVFVTEQYPKGLGPTVPEIASNISGFAPTEKLTFSACGVTGFLGKLAAQSVSQAILCGMEAHVCVLQTCLELLERGLQVFVVADAVASRTAENRILALDRMRAAGAAVVSTEMVLFECLGQAGTDDFKQIQRLVK